MQLLLRSFTQYVDDMASAMQAGSRSVLDLSVGSVIRTLLEASASVALWLQVLIEDVLAASRAGTARGTNLDTWMADFAFSRLPATHATGQATFSRTSTIGTVMVPVGTQVRSGTSNIIFTVSGDASHPNWDDAARGYTMADGQASVILPIIAGSPGPDGNVLAGAVTLLSSGIAGIDSIINDQPTVGGMAAESDVAFRRRFVDYLNSRSQATSTAVAYAIASARQGVRHRIYENSNADGSWQLGHFLVVIDDGSRNVDEHLLSTMALAVDAVRPVGSSFTVRGPVIVNCDISCLVMISDRDAPNSQEIRSSINNAIRAYVLELGIGDRLPISKLAQIIYSVNDRITNVLDIRINGQVGDIVPGPLGAVVPRLIAVS